MDSSAIFISSIAPQVVQKVVENTNKVSALLGLVHGEKRGFVSLPWFETIINFDKIHPSVPAPDTPSANTIFGYRGTRQFLDLRYFEILFKVGLLCRLEQVNSRVLEGSSLVWSGQRDTNFVCVLLLIFAIDYVCSHKPRYFKRVFGTRNARERKRTQENARERKRVSF
jgi:hypothetical protein